MRAMISAYTRECLELGKETPELGDPDNLKDIIEEYENKFLDDRLDNLIRYLGKNSKYYIVNIPVVPEKDYPITYSSDPQEFKELFDFGFKENLWSKGAKGTDLRFESEGWRRFENLMKKSS